MDTTNQDDRTWVVVLAGGDGTRLHPLTRALYGAPRPKQFAVLSGPRSLLQETVERAARLVPLERVMVVVSAHHEALAREQLAPYPAVELLVQPRNLDTGPGLLLPLARLRARDPGARVAFLPSDHHVADAGPLIDALVASARGQTRDRITLIGVHPDQPEIDYGWIVRGERLGRTADPLAYSVQSFREKPDAGVAEQLRAEGGLWNTFISTGPIATFWSLARRYLPALTARLTRYARRIGADDEADALSDAYVTMPAANFSRDLLARAPGLAVMPVAGLGWCDWGSPRRVFESLRGTPHHDALVARLSRTDPDAVHDLTAAS
jgi:mannose-1-phosphate guanylyltransferase